MNDQLAALALDIAEKRIIIGRLQAELQARDTRIAELEAEAAKKPASRSR